MQNIASLNNINALGIKSGPFTEAFLAEFSGASAGYSLRQLSTSATDVVRVRRSSDNAESDFTANELVNGTLLDYVVPTDVQALYSATMKFDDTGSEKRVVLDSEVDFSTNNFRAKANVIFENFNNARNVILGANTDNEWVMSMDNSTLFSMRESTSPNTIYTLTLDSALSINTIYTLEVERSGNTITLKIDGVTQANTITCLTASSFAFQAIGGKTSLNDLEGVIYDIEVYNSSNTLIHSYNGYGNTNADWTDQTGSNDGTVNGSPELFTGQGFDGYVTTWYDQRVPTSKDRMYFDGVNDYVSYDTGSTDSTFFANKTIKAKFIFDSVAGSQVIHTHGAAVGRLYLTSGTLHVGSTTDTGFTPVVDTLYDTEIDLDSSGNVTALRVNGNTEWTGTGIGVTSGESEFSVGARNFSGFGLFFNGLIYDVEISDTLLWNGYGNLDEDWTDQTGSNDGTVSGSPIRCLTDLTLAYDGIQTTSTRQPRIVADGSLVTLNSKPAIDFDGSNDYFLSWDYIVELSANDAQVSMVVDSDGTASQTEYILTEGDVVGPYSSNFILGGPSASTEILWVNASSFGTLVADHEVLGFQKTGGAGTGNKTFQAYRNGTTSGASGTATVNAETSTFTYIGASADGSTGFFNGKMQELVVYKNTTNSIVNMQNNQKNYYGI